MPQSIEVAGEKHDRNDGEIETSTSLPEFSTPDELLQYLESNHQQLEQDSLSIVLQLDDDLNITQWEQISAQIIELKFKCNFGCL